MKVKLLKKIRKRYSITRIDELESNAGEIMEFQKEKLGLPFFILCDDFSNDDEEYFESFNDSRDRLTEWINLDYREKFKHKSRKETKVWW